MFEEKNVYGGPKRYLKRILNENNISKNVFGKEPLSSLLTFFYFSLQLKIFLKGQTQLEILSYKYPDQPIHNVQ